MYKKDVLKHFGTVSEVAKAVGVSMAAVSQWGEIIPEKNAYRLQQVTKNKLRVDEKMYRRNS